MITTMMSDRSNFLFCPFQSVNRFACMHEQKVITRGRKTQPKKRGEERRDAGLYRPLSPTHFVNTARTQSWGHRASNNEYSRKREEVKVARTHFE
mmetsp:Transcript_53728/g.105076  ORF Transcript_53728/g.105076 Transcript_53728/m.105076 type:complete len:95 (+) Transcript_53728:2485-2769(+)